MRLSNFLTTSRKVRIAADRANNIVVGGGQLFVYKVLKC